MSSYDYSGKTVFVSGGTSGINLGIAHGFAKAGARLAVMSRSQDKVDAAVAELKAHGGDVKAAMMAAQELARAHD